jgi:cytochrome c-type biogenesis protein
MGNNVSYIAAFVAGIFSITSPCVLPIVPLYAAHLSGMPGASINDPTYRRRILANAFAYILGFSVVFISLGIALGAAGSLVSAASVLASHRSWLIRFGGVFLAVLGLQQIGMIEIPWLRQERRLAAAGKGAGRLTSSFLVGLTFGAGWSPCVGPILGAILTLAASQGDIQRAAVLLTLYSAGFAIPFLMLAIFGARSGILARISRRLSSLNQLAGAVMLAMGILMVLGLYQQFFARMVASSPWTPWEPRI